MAWHLQQLDASADVAEFGCGENSLDHFLRKYALGNDRAGLGRTFVALAPGEAGVVGFYTISTGSVRFDMVPAHLEKRLPNYPIPTVHIGRLAVDQRHQGCGLGKVLLIDALRKAAAASTVVGVYGVDVMALHERAKQFYLKYGFETMLDSPLHLFLPIETARRVSGITDE
jgi:GNAT superfamily N-acetyltransferase